MIFLGGKGASFGCCAGCLYIKLAEGLSVGGVYGIEREEDQPSTLGV